MASSRLALLLTCLLILGLCVSATGRFQDGAQQQPSQQKQRNVHKWRVLRETLGGGGSAAAAADGRWHAPWLGGSNAHRSLMTPLLHRAEREGMKRESVSYHIDMRRRAHHRMLAMRTTSSRGSSSSSSAHHNVFKEADGKTSSSSTSSSAAGAGVRPMGAGEGTSIVPYSMWGLTLPTGSYYLNITLGFPGQMVAVVMDTGSSLMWVPCDCVDCNQDASLAVTAYDSSKSVNASAVLCSNPLCLADYTFGCNRFDAPAPAAAADQSDLGPAAAAAAAGGAAGSGPVFDAPAGGKGKGDGDSSSSSIRDDECEFLYSYADNSSTSGRVLLDTFDLPSVSDGMIREKMLFGCGQVQSGNLAKSKYIYGLLGMGMGPISPLTQLYTGGHVAFAMAFCLDSTNATGSQFLLGRAPQPPNMRTTALVLTQRPFYFLDVVGLSVEGAPLRGSDRLSVADDSPTGGVIVDSGTTLTILPAELYAATLQAVFANREFFFIPELGLDCIILSYFESSSPAFPAIHMQMADGAVWSIPAANYLHKFEDGFDQYYCAAMMPSPSADFSVAMIIGESWLQDTYISIDIEKKRLGWASLNCSSGEYFTFKYTVDPFAGMSPPINTGASAAAPAGDGDGAAAAPASDGSSASGSGTDANSTYWTFPDPSALWKHGDRHPPPALLSHSPLLLLLLLLAALALLMEPLHGGTVL